MREYLPWGSRRGGKGFATKRPEISVDPDESYIARKRSKASLKRCRGGSDTYWRS